MSAEPDSLVLQLLRDMRANMATGFAEVRSEISDVRSEVRSLRADVASDLIAMEARQATEHKQTREQIVGLRRAVVEYHTSVIEHGIIISELEARVRRIEQRLDLPLSETHRDAAETLGPKPSSRRVAPARRNAPPPG